MELGVAFAKKERLTKFKSHPFAYGYLRIKFSSEEDLN